MPRRLHQDLPRGCHFWLGVGSSATIEMSTRSLARWSSMSSRTPLALGSCARAMIWSRSTCSFMAVAATLGSSLEAPFTTHSGMVMVADGAPASNTSIRMLGLALAAIVLPTNIAEPRTAAAIAFMIMLHAFVLLVGARYGASSRLSVLRRAQQS